MNPFVLWLPGALLLVAGVLVLALGQLTAAAALAIVGVGAALETAGVLLWVRQRRERRRGE